MAIFYFTLPVVQHHANHIAWCYFLLPLDKSPLHAFSLVKRLLPPDRVSCLHPSLKYPRVSLLLFGARWLILHEHIACKNDDNDDDRGHKDDEDKDDEDDANADNNGNEEYDDEASHTTINDRKIGGLGGLGRGRAVRGDR